mmetsp:Transcript_1534/g.3173  ORF Transcript_1534/g.3173 Transcript_1534/m.3173 type:complete len:265 (+) Transcript_1534:374-1168(+)
MLLRAAPSGPARPAARAPQPAARGGRGGLRLPAGRVLRDHEPPGLPHGLQLLGPGPAPGRLRHGPCLGSLRAFCRLKRPGKALHRRHRLGKARNHAQHHAHLWPAQRQPGWAVESEDEPPPAGLRCLRRRGHPGHAPLRVRGRASGLRRALRQPHRAGRQPAAHARWHLRRAVGGHRHLLHPERCLLRARLRRRSLLGLTRLALRRLRVLSLHRRRGPSHATAPRELAHHAAGALRLVWAAVEHPVQALRHGPDPAGLELRPSR